MNALPRLVLSLLLCLHAAHPARSCTTFVLQDGDQILFGRNLDWNWSEGLVVVNPRGLSKTAMVEPDEKPASWVASYGSVTFNQFGREHPFGGMNEAGLVVEQMMLMESQYPEPDARPAVEILQWIQYQLDTAATVAEVLASDTTVRIAPPQNPARIHFLVSDATGDAATIDYLGGRMVVHRGDALPYRALTNSTYAESAVFAARHPGGAGPVAEPDSLPRFACVAGRAATFASVSPEQDVAYAFESLEYARAGRWTVWQIVYDIPARRIHFRTTAAPSVRTIEMKPLDWGPASAPRFADMNESGSSEAVRFVPLTEAILRDYLEVFYSRTDLQETLGDLRPTIEPLLAALRGYTASAAN